MGATESVFYDDAPMEGLPRPMVAEPPPLPPSDRARPRPVINGNDAMRRSQPPQLQKPPRRRPPAQAKPIKKMEGLVMGGPKTGKRTLLSRLKGVDPFARKEKTNSNKAEETEEENPSITIQYKPPSESPTWDRIKLRIRYANSIDESTTASEKKENSADSQIDFVVLLISPKNSRDTTQSYLEGILTKYLDRLGYHKSVESNDENEERETETETDALALAPFCIAILFNFRDLEEGQIEEKDAPASRANLRRLVDDTLLSRNVNERKVVVELLETSLLNCYGLDGLHRFIYRTYLQRCQTDIERQLALVRNQIQLTEDKTLPKTGDKAVEVKAMSYDEFLKENAPKEEVAPPPQRQSKESAVDDRRKEEPVPRRTFGPKQTQTLRMGKDALEAFLASSSDEEETKQPASRRPRFPNANGYASSSSDDDSDDDFFYDESGNRRHQIHNQTPTKTAIRNEIADDESSNSSTSNDDEDRKVSSLPKASSENKSEELEQERNETAIQEVETVQSTTAELEEEVVYDEDENTDNTSTNDIETHDDTTESSTKEIHSVVEPNIADTKDGDDNGLSENSHEHINGEAGDPNPNAAFEDSDESNHDDVVNPETDDTPANGENDDDIAVAVTSSLNSEVDDDDDDFVINSTPTVQNVVEDNDDDDDDDDDDYMIQSTPDANEVSQGDDDDDDDDYMIDSSPAVQQVAEDDDGDGYMIGATSGVGKVIEDDDDDDDDDDGFIIGHPPVSGGKSVDEDDSDSDFIIEATEDANEDIDNSPTIRPADGQSTESASPNSTLPASREPSQPAIDSAQTPTKPAGGISQAALAAIAAAQEEAEAMIRQQQQQQYSEIPSKEKKSEKKSKKKKKDEKKKKKKKKSKGSDE